MALNFPYNYIRPKFRARPVRLEDLQAPMDSEVAAALSATFVGHDSPRVGVPASNLISIIGDSIAGGTTGGWWTRELSAASNGRVVEVINAGVGGNTSTQMRARIQADVLDQPLAPEWVIIEAVSPNDASQGIPLATARDNIVAMVAAVRAAGRRPVVCLGPPNDDTSRRDYLLNMNAWLTRWAEVNGVPCWDLYTPVADPADGTFLASMTTDGTHLSVAGAKAIASSIAASDLPAEMRKNLGRWVTGKNDPANLVINGSFVGDANADGLADSWYIGSGLATRSLVARSDGRGNWQQVTSAGGTEYFSCNNITTGYAVGDLIEMTAEVQITDGAGLTSFNLRPVHSTATALGVDWIYSGGSTPAGETVLVLRRFRVPAGATNIALRVILTGTGTARVGRVAYRNLTALGLA